MQTVWLGVDVGGSRKGFHLALIDSQRLLNKARAATAEDVVALARAWKPVLLAVDSPRNPATSGKARAEEAEFARARICHIRYTPTREVIGSNRYYEWIERGFALYEAITAAG